MARVIREPGSGEQGAVALMAALMLVTVFGFAALVIDIGSLYLTRRSLQAATDAAALAAVYGLNSAPLATPAVFAANYLGYNGYPAARLSGTPVVTVGRYCPLAATSPPTPASRFTAPANASSFCPPDSAGTIYGLGPNAVQVTASVAAPIFFAQVLLPGTTTALVTTTATATQSNETAFEVGSAVAGTTLAAVNAVQSGLLGSTVNLSSAAYQALTGTDVNAIYLLNALAALVGSTGTYGGLLSSTVSLYNLLAAAKTAVQATGGVTDTGNSLASVSTALTGLSTLQAAISGSPTLQLSQLIDPGLLENQGIGSVNPTTEIGAGLNLYDLATTAAEDAFGTAVITVPSGNLGSPGVYTVSGVYATTGAPQSPSAAFAPVGATLRTTPTRLQMEVTYAAVNQTILGIPLTSVTITLPLVINIGSGTVAASNGTAALSSMTCGPGQTTSAAIAASSAAAQGYIGTVTQAALANFSAALTVVAAPISVVSVLGIATFTVSGLSEVQVTTPAAATMLTFTQANMTAGTPQTVSGAGASTTLLSTLGSGSNLVTSTTFGVSLLPLLTLQLDAPLVGSAVAATLTPAFLAGLDPLVDSVLAGLGVKFGYLDVIATGIRCGVPSLVL